MEAAPAAGEEHPHLPALQVVASDGEPYSARYVWHSPVHENDRLGRLPSGPGAADHRDVALLRVMLPLGQSYGRIELPDPPISWSGPRLLALVHYPDGERRGFCTGRVLREADTDLRLRHNVRTAPGSSGGPGFDRNLEFIGLHQGRRRGVSPAGAARALRRRWRVSRAGREGPAAALPVVSGRQSGRAAHHRAPQLFHGTGRHARTP